LNGVPIFEYSCNACGHQFELLVMKTTVPACPECKSSELDRHFSLPAVSSDTTRANAIKAGKRRNVAKGQEREAAQREYERNHDND
jgi:putative FmdB family regulatory protein